MKQAAAILTLMLAGLLLTATIGCGPNISNQLKPAQEKLLIAREHGARFCSPEHFAAAEAYLDFAENSAKAGNRMDADVYLARADKELEIALAACEDCRTDLDGDGIVDIEDKDPYRAEDYDKYQDEDGVPEDDNDGDNYLDPEDQCPLDPEDMDGFEDNDGCPDPDNDFDGILDELDQCPNEPEDVDGYQDLDGCPDPDNDSDGIADSEDVCPNHPETINGFLDDDGCPDRIPTRRKFILLPDVKFLGGSLYLTPASIANLQAFANALKRNPDLHVRIEGHTYARSSEDADLTLTKQRAELVRDLLVGHGIATERLTPMGFGATRPIADNETYAGRMKNDRIDFIIYLP
ncbi:MAG TPA: OmpA family protein [bacterium]|nr:OmpA family protein [bacterium]